MNVILFGFQGAGKTHFGRLLAKKLSRPFIDTDDVLSELYAKQSGERLTPREIYRILGETGFRALETQAILALMDLQNTVIALGGGAVLDRMNVEMLEKMGQLVYLAASFETLQKRGEGKSPAAFAKDLRASYAARKPIYESIPAKKIDLDLLDEEGILALLISVAILS